jgi:putative transposase
MGHKGSKGFLNAEQKQQALVHIQSHKVFGPTELTDYLQTTFEVCFKSMQSYYELLHEAGMSWHKSQKANPKKDGQQVGQRRKELKKS